MAELTDHRPPRAASASATPAARQRASPTARRRGVRLRRVASAAPPRAATPTLRTTDADGDEVFGAALYGDEADAAPRRPRSTASLGCGVPTAVADLHEGETVLDLGSGAGADVLHLRPPRRPDRHARSAST